MYLLTPSSLITIHIDREIRAEGKDGFSFIVKNINFLHTFYTRTTFNLIFILWPIIPCALCISVFIELTKKARFIHWSRAGKHAICTQVSGLEYQIGCYRNFRCILLDIGHKLSSIITNWMSETLLHIHWDCWNVLNWR